VAAGGGQGGHGVSPGTPDAAAAPRGLAGSRS